MTNMRHTQEAAPNTPARKVVDTVLRAGRKTALCTTIALALATSTGVVAGRSAAPVGDFDPSRVSIEDGRLMIDGHRAEVRMEEDGGVLIGTGGNMVKIDLPGMMNEFLQMAAQASADVEAGRAPPLGPTADAVATAADALLADALENIPGGEDLAAAAAAAGAAAPNAGLKQPRHLARRGLAPRDDVVCNCPGKTYCYQSLEQCGKAGQGKLRDSPRECAMTLGPVYRCEGEDFCRTIDTCQSIMSAAGKQDPHMKGFNGADYYFEGHSGRVYNIITDADFQMNAQFTRLDSLKGTYMNRLGIRVGNDTVAFHPHFGVFLNGQKLAVDNGHPYALDYGRSNISVDIIDGTHRMTVKTPSWQVAARAIFEKARASMTDAYINLNSSLLGRPRDPHGVLGQSARFMVDSRFRNSPEGFRVEGEEDDYEVLDGLFGTDFMFNRFDEQLDLFGAEDDEADFADILDEDVFAEEEEEDDDEEEEEEHDHEQEDDRERADRRQAVHRGRQPPTGARRPAAHRVDPKHTVVGTIAKHLRRSQLH
ncbi:hypothetical protein H696_05825 [Fonticula alba]|uniref:VWFD domain-containing protein n=1 Tax=Fonticula alba TaxID=691883 RepID=A0A058Z2G5_FONAL|nr:hypothetical protein H696_05825 [Fonticula alba]KCV67717.1 hypothetical protein H696_05825 [Fonticula alba]|eukprot:XP_009497901.1 hypothetical protein H696_05825 [Fonticula alba]